MITKEHIKTFNFFGGDIDGWARMKYPRDTMTDDIWFEIENILHNLILINNGVTSKEFAAQTFRHLKSTCENLEVEQLLIKLAKANK